MSAPAGAVVLRAEGISKAWSTPVLDRVSLDLRGGEVHVLMGSNGAGKSTLAAILGGLVPADAGQMTLGPIPHAPRSRAAAEAAGVVMVLQEMNLFPGMSLAENLFLDRLPSRFGLVDRATLHRRAVVSLERVGLSDLDPRMPLARLGVGKRQLVEIARALDRRCRVLILDEPTAALSARESDLLFDHVRRLVSEGVSVVYVTHRLDELPRIASRVSVLRDGRFVAEHLGGNVAPGRLIEEMSGRASPQGSAAASAPAGDVVLAVAGLERGARVRKVSLVVRSGEVLGLAGLVGAGRTELLRTIFGADPAAAGTVRVGDGRAGLLRSPRQAVAAGIGMLPEDRRHDGLLLGQSMRVNALLLPGQPRARSGWIDRPAERRAAEAIRTGMEVDCTSIEQPVGQLSGGNQQKVVLGRWLAAGCRVLLCDEPTRGVDAAVKGTIHRLLREFVNRGGGVLRASGELAELRAICDRVLVMAAGRIVAEFPRGWSDEAVTAAAFESAMPTSAEKAGHSS
ncbi:MAG: sugar ABC transporter ATP-binding protein [Planctomycetota bacterium]|nr:MAG: sugar ABC transporter ATP-binding protein [Planctomycetota bacterium]